jgi:hypothetical protein
MKLDQVTNKEKRGETKGEKRGENQGKDRLTQSRKRTKH